MALAARTLPPERDDVIALRGATWADYQRVLEIRGDAPAPRLTYLRGTLELMNPSRRHESIKSTIGCLVEAWCVERGIEISPYGSWTLDDAASERAIEPDECYVLGDVEEPERPDLAIEVFWTSGRLDRLEVYRTLGVREVWIWKQGTITPWILRGERYEAVAQSEVLGGIDLAALARFVDTKPTTRAVREYLRALRG